MRDGDLNSSSYTSIASGFTNWAISSQSCKHGFFFFIIKNCARDAGVIGSAFRSTSHSSRGPRFSSQHPHRSSQPSVTPATGDLMSFPGLCRYCSHITQTCMQVHICTDYITKLLNCSREAEHGCHRSHWESRCTYRNEHVAVGEDKTTFLPRPCPLSSCVTLSAGGLLVESFPAGQIMSGQFSG